MIPIVAALADAGPKGTGEGVLLLTLIIGVPVLIIVLFVRWILRSTRDANRPFDGDDGDDDQSKP